MRGLFVAVLVCAAPVHAMTSQDCQRFQSVVAKIVPAANDLRLAPSVTQDGWCRVIDGPLGDGLEWQVSGDASAFLLEFRQSRLEIESLGPFALTGIVQAHDGGGLQLGPVRLEMRNEDGAQFLAALSDRSGNSDFATDGLQITEAGLSVGGKSGLVNDVLAWAFRLEQAAADSSLIAARRQRDLMLEWLEDEASRVMDPGSADEFREMVDAYPRARGVASISVGSADPIAIGPLLNAVLFGSDFTRGQAADLIADLKLQFSWRPE